jgi:hypothetical protein
MNGLSGVESLNGCNDDGCNDGSLLKSIQGFAGAGGVCNSCRGFDGVGAADWQIDGVATQRRRTIVALFIAHLSGGRNISGTKDPSAAAHSTSVQYSVIDLMLRRLISV